MIQSLEPEAPVTATAQHASTEKAQFLDTFERECQTTLRVLRAYPTGMENLQPHPRCRNAVGLAWIFVGEMGMLQTALTTGFDWSRPPESPPAPKSMEEVIASFDHLYKQVLDVVRGTTEADLRSETVQFPAGPGKMATLTRMQFLWFVLSDQIHHRGQFSIYLRMAGGKLPSIYGPTADEPWM
jgi:hypothetical protein